MCVCVCVCVCVCSIHAVVNKPEAVSDTVLNDREAKRVQEIAQKDEVIKKLKAQLKALEEKTGVNVDSLGV